MSAELAELQKISRILALVNAKAIEDELLKYATTDNRKKTWVLINGKRMPNDIAQSVGISTRAIDQFLKVLEVAGLIENLWGKPPRKLLDYVPASWLGLVKVEVLEERERLEDAN